MTKNLRYEAYFDALNDQRIEQATRSPSPCTLPMQAYGPQPIEWHGAQPPEVWAWVSWRDGPATRIPAVAAGWNDRVVIVEWEAAGGKQSVVVWRTAVTWRRPRAPHAPIV